MTAERGFVLIEVVLAMLAFVVLASVAFQGSRVQLAAIEQGMAETRATGLVAARLAELRVAPARLAVGTQAFSLAANRCAGLQDVTGEQSVREVEPGVLEVVVVVTWRPRGAERTRSTELRTWMVRAR
ncbi:MAG: hypothetical protein KDC87_01625 [Planctomycetes bacterium]|nr:hypothetical protein [Planctomycetota bacterium]MCB9872073.1 hypothetical protein [Planctomycetota bacterium]